MESEASGSPNARLATGRCQQTGSSPDSRGGCYRSRVLELQEQNTAIMTVRRGGKYFAMDAVFQKLANIPVL